MEFIYDHERVNDAGKSYVRRLKNGYNLIYYDQTIFNMTTNKWVNLKELFLEKLYKKNENILVAKKGLLFPFPCDYRPEDAYGEVIDCVKEMSEDRFMFTVDLNTRYGVGLTEEEIVEIYNLVDYMTKNKQFDLVKKREEINAV